jgi:hypothetical protein
MEHHDLAISTHSHIRFEVSKSEVDGLTERHHRVFGPQMGAPSVREASERRIPAIARSRAEKCPSFHALASARVVHAS